MNKQKPQSGNVHLILALVLCFALVGALGFVVYRNYILKTDDVNKVDDNSKINIIDTNKSSDDVLLETAYDKTTGSGLAIKYPKNWTAVNTTNSLDNGQETDITRITSPDGKVTVRYHVMLTTGIGGICEVPEGDLTRLVVLNTDTLPGYKNVNAISGYENARFVAYVDHHTLEDKYSYFVGAQVTDEYVLKIKVGYTTVSCDSFGMDHYGAISIDKIDKNDRHPLVSLGVELNDITADSKLVDINDAMKSDSFLIAKQIVQSLFVKDN